MSKKHSQPMPKSQYRGQPNWRGGSASTPGGASMAPVKPHTAVRPNARGK